MAKKTVFLTGGTGNMGWAAVQEMVKHPNDINPHRLIFFF